LANEIVISIRGKDDFSATIDGVQKKAGGLGDVLGKVGTIAGGFLAANVIQGGVQKLTGFIGDSIAAAKESIAVDAQLAAVLKSTGGAAGVTAEEVKGWASALEKASLFEDEAILKGQNLLLTFTGIGKETFPRATQAMVDMAQAMGTDASGAAIQLGKALNDPTQGISALSRVGVSFTDQQKEQIKAMQEAGDIAGAQAIILAELEKEFGGSAKAASDAAGASEQYKDRMNDLKEQIGSKLLPIQEKWMELQAKVVSFIADTVIPTVETFIKYLKAVVQDGDTLNDWLAGMPEPLQGFAKAVGEVVLFVKEHWSQIEAVFAFVYDFVKAKIEGMIQVIGAVVEIVTSVVNLVSDLFHGRWAQAWGEMKDIAGAIVDGLLGYIAFQFGNIPGIILGFAGDAANAAAELGNSIAKGLGNAVIDGVNFVIRQINTFLRKVSSIKIHIPEVDIPLVGKVGGGTVGMPDLGSIEEIGGLAKGGITTGPMLALLGDNPSGREAVIPLDSPQARGALGGGQPVNVYVQGSILSERDLLRIVRDALANGSLAATTG